MTLLGELEKKLGPAADLITRNIARLPPMHWPASAHHFALQGSVVHCGLPLPPAEDACDVQAWVRTLMPWRKGPFCLAGHQVDAEWRSDWKWQRIAEHLGPLDGARILDLGCNNGYTLFRMLAAGAREVWGIDPTLRYGQQLQLALRLAGPLPLRFDALGWQELPPGLGKLDLILCLGVLYHQGDQLALLRTLNKALTQAGRLILETIVLPGQDAHWILPKDRYACMRNVGFLPTGPALQDLLVRAGFSHIQQVEQHPHSPEEQRSTALAPGPSFRQFLDPLDPLRTLEGWPAPQRCTLVVRP